MPKIITATLLIIFLLLIVSLFKKEENIPLQTTTNSQESPRPTEDLALISTVATNLEVPWALAFLPDGSILITERVGRIRIINKEGKLQEKPIATLSQVEQTGEGGLHGIAIHPQYPNPPYIYLYYTYSTGGDNSLNRVSRFIYEDQTLKDEEVVVDKIPGAIFHDGGRIKFGPDKSLYITTGDALNPTLAQDKNSLAGKILRVKDPSTRSVNSGQASSGQVQVEVVSYGHRNPQGIAWDKSGRLWGSEHGQSATDELNLIQPVRNYGWPITRGDQTQAGMESPIIHSGSATWAPAGMAYHSGSLYFAGLKGQALFQFNIESKTLKEHFKGQLGRIREVVLGPDNMLYITTSNRDGRGFPASDDDKIIKINPEKL